MDGSFGLLLDSWGALGATLEASWILLEPSWSHLGDVLGALGPIVGANWELKGCQMRVPEASKQSLWRTQAENVETTKLEHSTKDFNDFWGPAASSWG